MAENRVIAVLRRYTAAAFARDWDALAETLADSYRMEDRRTGLKNTYDKAGDMERAKVTADVGFDDLMVEAVEARGEGCALLRAKLSAKAADYAIESLLVVRVDTNDRMAEAFLFEAEDLESARAQLAMIAGC